LCNSEIKSLKVDKKGGGTAFEKQYSSNKI